MSKAKSKQLEAIEKLDDMIAELDSLDLWDIADPADQMFWEEFFRVEDALEMSDEFDAPSFTITVQNHRTGEIKTFSNIKLLSSKRTVVC